MSEMDYDMTVEVFNLDPTEVSKVDNIFSELVDVSIPGWLATDQDNMHLYTTKIRFDVESSLFAERFCKIFGIQ